MLGLNLYLGIWEPLWLFAILTGELLFGMATFAILVKEYFYDMEQDQRKTTKRTRKKKVVIQIQDGQAQIIEQPKDVEIVMENK
jgi:hypothetical protein